MLTLSTSPELETRLQAEAKRFGLTPEEKCDQLAQREKVGQGN